MNPQDIQKHIDRVVGTDGTLRIPSWWMHKILSDIVRYCEEKGNGDVDELRNEIYKGISDEDIKFLKENGVLATVENTMQSNNSSIYNINERINALESRQLVIISNELPANPKSHTIYLVPAQSVEENNIFVEWIYTGGSWEKLGEFKTDVNLSEYAKKDELAFTKDANENICNDFEKSRVTGENNFICMPAGNGFVTGNGNVVIGGIYNKIVNDNAVCIGVAMYEDDKLSIGTHDLGDVLVVDRDNNVWLRGFGYNGNRNYMDTVENVYSALMVMANGVTFFEEEWHPDSEWKSPDAVMERIANWQNGGYIPNVKISLMSGEIVRVEELNINNPNIPICIYSRINNGVLEKHSLKFLPDGTVEDNVEVLDNQITNLDIPKTIVVEDSMLKTSSYVTDIYNTIVECNYAATVKYRKDNKVYDCYLVYKDPNFESIYLMYATIYFDEVVSNKIRIYKNGECGKSTETFTNKHTINTFSANDGNVLNGLYKGSNREGEVARFNWYSNNPDRNFDCQIEYVCKGGSLEFPNDIFWSDGQLPEFKKYHRYIININNQMGKFVEFYRKILFTVDGEEFEFYLDATLENFINDGVDPNFEIGDKIENTDKFGVLYKGAKLLSEDNVEVSISDLLIDGHKYVTQKANSLDDLIGTYSFTNSGTSLGSTKPTLSKNGNDIVFTNLLGGGPAVVVTFDETNNTITVPKGWSSSYIGPVDVDLVFNVDFDTHTLTMTPSSVTIGGWASVTNYVLTKV